MANATIPEDLAILLGDTQQWPDYQNYRPLSRQRSEIRLLKIYFDHRRILCGRFLHASLDEDHLQYEAISYCWGPPGTQRPFFIDGQKLMLRASLHNFLTILCSKHDGQSLPVWVDSVCINQRDVAERNHQVTLMGRIYSNAAQVLVWLGDFTPDADFLLLFLQHYQDPRFQNCENRSSIEQNAYQSITDIVHRPYWQRLWIVQELFLAKRVQVWCGSRLVEWSNFLNGLDHLHNLHTSSAPRHVEVLSDQTQTGLMQFFHFVQSVRNLPSSSSSEIQSSSGDTSSTLYNRMSQFSEQKCHDPRDRVYGLVSLATDAAHLDIDYTKTMLEIAFDVVMLTWAPPGFNGFLDLDGPRMKSFNTLVMDVYKTLHCHADISMCNVDASSTLHLRLHPSRLPEQMPLAAYKRYLDENGVTAKFSQLGSHSHIILRRDGVEFDKCLWEPFPPIATCFYPHRSTDWPCADDWIFTCKWWNKPLITTFIFRSENATKTDRRFVGVLHSIFHPCTRSTMAELLAENEHLHLKLINEVFLDNDHLRKSELSLEISKLLLFQTSLVEIGACSSLSLLEEQRSKRWPTDACLRRPIFRKADGTAEWNFYNEISKVRSYARYQLRDACHDLLRGVCNSDRVIPFSNERQDEREEFHDMMEATVLHKFYRVFRFTGEVATKDWYHCAMGDKFLRQIKADGSAASHLGFDLHSLSLELQDQYNMVGLIAVDQLVSHIGSTRVEEQKASPGSTRVSDSRFEDFWMDIGLYLLSPLLCSVEQVVHAELAKYDQEYLNVHADWVKSYTDYTGKRYTSIRQHFNVWHHHDEIKAAVRTATAK